MIAGCCASQEEAARLVDAGATVIAHDSDTRWVFQEVLSKIGAGDTLIVHEVRPFANSTLKLIRLVASVVDKGANFRSLAEPWLDMTGRAATFAAGIAEFEREILRRRTARGRATAVVAGVPFGRPPKLSESQRDAAFAMYESGVSQTDIARLFNLSPTSISTLVRDRTAQEVA